MSWLPSRSRLQALRQLQCDIFQTSFNPTSVRTGAKYLRARLRGPSMVNYYPSRVSIPRINGLLKRMHNDALNKDKNAPEPPYLVDEAEQTRLADIEALKARGKGKPKKITNPAMSPRAKKKGGGGKKK